jgi:hypothetical protein
MRAVRSGQVRSGQVRSGQVIQNHKMGKYNWKVKKKNRMLFWKNNQK